MHKVYTMRCKIKLEQVTWDDLKEGDIIYYLTDRQRRRDTREPHGPFIVSSAPQHIRNENGVELFAGKWNIILFRQVQPSSRSCDGISNLSIVAAKEVVRSGFLDELRETSERDLGPG